MNAKDQATLKAEFFCLLDDSRFQATPRLEFTDQVRNGAVLFKHHLISPLWSETGMLMGDALCIGPTQKFRDWIRHGVDIVKRREAWREEVGIEAAKNPTDDLLIAHPLIRYAMQKEPALRRGSTLHCRKDVLVGTAGFSSDAHSPQVVIDSLEGATEIIIPEAWPESVLSAVAGKYLHEIVEFAPIGDPDLEKEIAGLKVEGANRRDTASKIEMVTLHLGKTRWVPLKGKRFLSAHQNHPYFA